MKNTNNEYYDGAKLLSLKDLNGKQPEMYISCTNRSAGKTTYFGRLLVNRFKKYKSKFLLLYRYKYELEDCADKFFSDIKKLFFPEDVMTSNSRGGGAFKELMLNEVTCGYAISINSADLIKKYSHFFNTVECMLFDEFQSETDSYCANEINKFISIHTSIARGNGQQSRYVPVYMLSNNVDILNPYYTALGITKMLTPQTKFLRGNGWVLEKTVNDYASERQKNSAFIGAFNNNYTKYITSGDYLISDSAFIDTPKGGNRYICTIRYNGTDYGLREYYDDGIYYCDTSFDKSCKRRIAVTTQDMKINYVMLQQHQLLIIMLKNAFQRGLFRFKNAECKNAILSMLEL